MSRNHVSEMHEPYDRHHKVSPTLNSYYNKKRFSYIKYPKSGGGAFLDISVINTHLKLLMPRILQQLATREGMNSLFPGTEIIHL